jgi:uncharacterized protein
MRVVVDTNVFVSAALSAKSSPALVCYLIKRQCVLLRSITTEQELLHVIARPRLASLIAPPFLEGLSELMGAAELVAITEKVTECRDPKDNKFLELALNGKADFIVTGDQDLLMLNPFRGISIVNPAEFVKIITG